MPDDNRRRRPTRKSRQLAERWARMSDEERAEWNRRRLAGVQRSSWSSSGRRKEAS